MYTFIAVPQVSALQNNLQRPMFNSPNSTAMQVRQSLLQQQKLKQLREVEKQKQDRQRYMLHNRLNHQFNQRFPHVGFTPLKYSSDLES